MAQKDGIDWLLHVDTDELIYPSGSPTYSLQVRACVNYAEVGGGVIYRADHAVAACPGMQPGPCWLQLYAT